MPRERTSIFKNVKTDRGFSASTGLNQAEFNALAEKFSLYYRPTVLVGFPEGFGNDSIFTDSNEALFFLLYAHKTGLSYDVLGINFGMSRATAHSTEKLLKRVLKSVLRDVGVLPKRLFSSVTEMEAYFEEVDELVIDATEIPSQRPQNEKEQRERYSKKNINTVTKTR